MDSRIRELARIIVTTSVDIQPNENVFIEGEDDSHSFVQALIDEVYRVGGRPYFSIVDSQTKKRFILGATEEQLNLYAETEIYKISKMQAYIGIRGMQNISEFKDIPADKMALYAKYNGLIAHARTARTKGKSIKWCTLRHPNAAMAQYANMGTKEFEDFYFNVCNLDYADMRRRAQPLVDRMVKTDKVHIIAPGTDLTFSIKGTMEQGSTPCIGYFNLPDGEAACDPVVDSANGTITYNMASFYQNFVFENVCLTFENGKIIKATANNTELLNAIFDTDPGARYVGEFAIGLNPYIEHPIVDILFDEKMFGTLHFTPGYGPLNKSSVHWDLLQNHFIEYGGGEIWFDDTLIRKDGYFVPQDLQALNRNNYPKID